MDENTKELIYAVRNALEDKAVNSLYVGFQSFPFGSCMDASILLGTILTKTGKGSFNYTSSKNGEGVWHSWIENDVFIIDITANQFPGIDSKVLIIEQSDDYQHLGFEIVYKRDVSTASISDTGYRQVLKLICSNLGY